MRVSIKTISLIIILPLILTAQNLIHVPADYPTIQIAVENSKDNDTILVAKGVYFEKITITKPITVLGTGICETIIKPNSTFGLPILVTAIGACLNNIRVTASHNKYGISIENSVNCTIKNCIVDSTRTPISMFYGEDAKGINIVSSDNITIINCVVKNNSGGGFLPDGASNGYGIYIFGSSNVRVTSTRVTNNKGGGPSMTCPRLVYQLKVI